MRSRYFLLAAVVLAAFVFVRLNRASSPQDFTILLPDGFEAVVVADSIGPARHISVTENGDIYVSLRRAYDEGSVVALRDTTGDGRADVVGRFGIFKESKGSYHTAAKIRDGYLYVSTELTIYRFRLTPGQLIPAGKPDTLVIDDHPHGSHEHNGKPLSFDNYGHIYVPFGAPNNACQDPKRTPGVPGRDPCPDLEDHAGIWRFDKDKTNQTQRDGYKFASGLRSIVAMDWNPFDETLYAVMHGRDDLHRLWPNTFSLWDNAMLPAEEFMRVTEGSHFGWPYCYYDQIQGKKVLAPEYGGDGETVGRCSAYDNPLVGFPGHFAPNDLLFYRGGQFPDRYKDGAFIAFHGSTIRAPYPQAGYFVAFVPFRNGAPSGDWEVFANGFAQFDPIENTSDAAHRPVGLAEGPDGSLYVTDSKKGKIWRIRYTGDRDAFGEAQLARMVEEKNTASNIRTPDEEADHLQRGERLADEKLYDAYCAPCHQRDGEGASPRYPPLAGSEWVTGDKVRLIKVIVGGLEGPIEVRGQPYNNVMPQHSFLSDEEVAAVATFIRRSFGNRADAVSAEEVKQVRKQLSL